MLTTVFFTGMPYYKQARLTGREMCACAILPSFMKSPPLLKLVMCRRMGHALRGGSHITFLQVTCITCIILSAVRLHDNCGCCRPRHATRLNAEIPSCMTEGAQTMRDVGEPIGSWKEERDI